MDTELEELIEFLGHPHPQIHQLAVEHLVPYSASTPAIFKVRGQEPVKNVKALLGSDSKVAEHAITVLINLSADRAVLEELVGDDKFLDPVLGRIVDRDEPNADLFTMLLANLAKSDRLHTVLLTKRRRPPEPLLGGGDLVLDQLVDVFGLGASRAYNKHASFDHLAYVFADLSRHAPIRAYFVAGTQGRPIPLTKIKPFVKEAEGSLVRRRGTASTIKNVAFEVSAHPSLLASEADSPGADTAVIDILPYLLLPIMGPEEYELEDTFEMLPEIQLLPPDKRRDPDNETVRILVETLLLLATTRPGRERLRQIKLYPIIRETHAAVDDDGVRDACGRLVQLLMRDEGEEEGESGRNGARDGENGCGTGSPLLLKSQGRVAKIVDEDDGLVEV